MSQKRSYTNYPIITDINCNTKKRDAPNKNEHVFRVLISSYAEKCFFTTNRIGCNTIMNKGRKRAHDTLLLLKLFGLCWYADRHSPPLFSSGASGNQYLRWKEWAHVQHPPYWATPHFMGFTLLLVAFVLLTDCYYFCKSVFLMCCAIFHNKSLSFLKFLFVINYFCLLDH